MLYYLSLSVMLVCCLSRTLMLLELSRYLVACLDAMFYLLFKHITWVKINLFNDSKSIRVEIFRNGKLFNSADHAVKQDSYNLMSSVLFTSINYNTQCPHKTQFKKTTSIARHKFSISGTIRATERMVCVRSFFIVSPSARSQGNEGAFAKVSLNVEG